MRGKLPVAAVGGPDGGLIPAHAGKTISLDFLRKNSGAHPRACGENSALPWLVGLLGGSSPRMRGKPVTEQATEGATRLIPAHAGKTQGDGEGGGQVGAHPRACGENLAALIVTEFSRGSSPRMRGKRSEALEPGRIERLIPAHAGKTPHGLSRQARSPAHPRACGENVLSAFHEAFSRGSSPRMRGKRYCSQDRCFLNRLIPAHAGKT